MKKRLNCLKGDVLDLYAVGKSREEAWTAITNIGAEVLDCSALIVPEPGVRVNGQLKNASLLVIERLEKEGWTW